MERQVMGKEERIVQFVQAHVPKHPTPEEIAEIHNEMVDKAIENAKWLELEPRLYQNPYGTHRRAIIDLAQNCKIRKILEFGAGKFSTEVFLERHIFKDLTHLFTCEENKEWLPKQTDPRLQIFNAHENAFPGILDLITEETDLDLVFVDNYWYPVRRW
jgi:hypothetical protein